MILLQAAIGFGILLIGLLKGVFFIGIPLLAKLLFKIQGKDKMHENTRQRNKSLRESVLLAAFIIVVALVLICVFLSQIELAYT